MKKLGHFYLISVLLFVSFYAQSQNIKCGQQETSTSSLVKPLGDILSLNPNLSIVELFL